MADRQALLLWQVIRLLKNDGYFWLEFTEKSLRNPKSICLADPHGGFCYSNILKCCFWDNQQSGWDANNRWPFQYRVGK